jgi:hypothetical protein
MRFLERQYATANSRIPRHGLIVHSSAQEQHLEVTDGRGTIAAVEAARRCSSVVG